MTFDGRVEARINVPAGTTVQATTDLGTSTVTIPQGSYFWTSAGGQTGLLATIAAQLNASAPPAAYPRNAVAATSAIGYGLWTNGSGWLCDDTSSPLNPVFGSVSLTTAGGAPTFGTTLGPRGGTDKAITMTGSDQLSGGANFDVASGEDLAIAGVFRVSSSSGFSCIVGKGVGGDASYWTVYVFNGLITLRVVAASVITEASATFTDANDWCVFVAAVDRTAGTARIAFRSLASSSTAATSASTAVSGAFSSANPFIVGANGGFGANAATVDLAGLYAVKGSGVSVGLPANLAIATSNFTNAINATWSVSMSTGATGTGKITANVPGGAVQPAWALAWNSTSLRDIAGFTSDAWAGYPRTAAETASTIGYGTWGAGWLFNEAAGASTLSAAYGSPAFLLSVGTPTAGLAGPLGGADLAVTIPAASNTQWSAGNVNDVTATTDLVVAWVARIPSGFGFDCLLSKGSAGTAQYWALFYLSGIVYLRRTNASTPVDTTTPAISFPSWDWHVGIAAFDRAAGTARVGVRSLITGTSYVSTNDALAAVTFSNASNMTLGVNGGFGVNADALDVAALYVGSGSGVAAGVPANLSTALANFAAMVGSRTGANQARALWIPDCPLVVDGDPRRAPKVSDLRTTTSPTGAVYGLVGNTFYRQKNAKWSHVPEAKTWERSATIANASWETFFNETQLGLGSTTWFTPASPVQIYDHLGRLAGGDANSGVGLANGWQMTGVTSIEPKRVDTSWTGLWSVQLPELVSSG